MNEVESIVADMRKMMDDRGLLYDDQLFTTNYSVRANHLELRAIVTYDIETSSLGHDDMIMERFINIEVYDYKLQSSYALTNELASADRWSKIAWNTEVEKVLAKLKGIKLLADKI